jgi:4-hydroxy-2-oxoglutarate aldolase
LCGLFLPTTTPFLSDGSLDVVGLRGNIRKWNQTHISGYVMLGSTGERVHLDEREYVQVIEEARQEIPSHLILIAGAGQQSTYGTIAEIKRAAAAGVDAVLVITPNFYRAAITPDALIKHYSEVAEASPVPVILYSMPDLTGIKIEPKQAAALSTHPNIIGIKDSSADIERLGETVDLVRNAGVGPADFAVLTGNGTVLFEALTARADGAILAVGCAAPALCLEIIEAFRNQDHARSQTLQASLTPLARAVTKTYGIGGLKAALDLIGYTGGEVRAPLRAPGAEAREEIQSHLTVAESAVRELLLKVVV